jgi:hypothetical protein
MVEQINQQWRLDQATSIPPQTAIFDIYPKLSEIDLLLGIVPIHAPWAYFFPPKKYRSTRRSPFSFSRVAPSLGTSEELEEREGILDGTFCETAEEQREKEILQACFKQMNKINSWLGYIIGRIGQFLQG